MPGINRIECWVANESLIKTVEHRRLTFLVDLFPK